MRMTIVGSSDRPTTTLLKANLAIFNIEKKLSTLFN